MKFTGFNSQGGEGGEGLSEAANAEHPTKESSKILGRFSGEVSLASRQPERVYQRHTKTISDPHIYLKVFTIVNLTNRQLSMSSIRKLAR